MKEIFERIAPYYDRLMQNIDYEGWVDYFVKLCEFFEVYPKKILDIGCGTGTPTRHLVERGYEVIGIDESEKMLKIAREKLKNSKKVKFLKMNMRNINLDEQFDAAFSFFDTMNYILDEKDMIRCMSGVYRVLKNSGIFIFDMNTYYSLKEIWNNSTTVKEVENIFSIWKNKWDEDKKISTLNLILQVKENDKKLILEETHRERAYFPWEIEKIIKKVGFKESHFFEFKTFNDISETTIRMVVVGAK